MTDELKMISKKVVMAHLRQYPGIFLEGLRKTQETSQDSRYPRQYSKRAYPEYKSRAVYFNKKFWEELIAYFP
jgi:hypothetical protein